MTRYYYANIEFEELPHCCGIFEAGSFSSHSYESDFHHREADPKSETEAWIAELKLPEKFPVIFNFVKFKESSKFKAAILRDLIMARKDCLFLHAWINPNSGNLIESYMVTNGSTNRKKRK